MIVADILKNMNAPVERINENKTVLEAIKHLTEKRYGSLMVEDDEGKIAGIITERDILNESAERSHLLGETPVRKVMTRNLITGVPEDKITALLGVMTERRVRHLPIMDGDDLVGLVSIGDLVKAELEEIAHENRHLRQYIQGG